MGADVTNALEAAKATELRSWNNGEFVLGSARSTFEPAFGYLSRSAGAYTEAVTQDGANLPSSALDLAVRNFKRELPELLKTINGSAQAMYEPDVDSPEAVERSKLDSLVLDNDAVWAREKQRPPVKAPLLLLGPYYVLCWCLDACFE